VQQHSAKKMLQTVIMIAAIAFALFQIMIVLKPIDAMALRSVHLAFVLFLVFLVNGVQKKENPGKIDYLYSIGFAVLSVISCLYIFLNSHELNTTRLGLYTDNDLLFGFIIIISVMLATWRIYGTSITSIIVVALLYVILGDYLPEFIGHTGITYQRAISNLSLFTEGIFGAPLGAAASVVSAFIIFASFIQTSGGAELFMGIAINAFGRFSGGAAKIAVVASSLFGMISGSAAANTAGTGMITIPLMKKSGFEARVAGAVEASASTGGQLMPPIMGSAAFLIAEILGVSYFDVMVAAIAPAVIYYVSIFMSVHLYSKKNNITGIEVTENKESHLLAKKGHLLIPLVILLVLIGYSKLTPQMAALLASISVVVVSFFRKETRFNLKMIKDALYNGAMGILEISVICAAAGIILGVFNVTGLGLKLSSAIISLSGGSLLSLMIFAMLASLILGMGLPTVAAYIILAVLVAPAMVSFGVVPMAAHLYVFYFGILSVITPPVAIAAYVGAGIAGANPFKVGLTACGLAFPGFIIPYVFVYQPAMLLMGQLSSILQVCVTTAFSAALFAAFFQGFIFTKLFMYERVVLFISAILLVIPETYTDLAGLIVAVLMLAKVYNRDRKERKAKLFVSSTVG
jgi:TRAP transporter 4TM/12TM fusion protein